MISLEKILNSQLSKNVLKKIFFNWISQRKLIRVSYKNNYELDELLTFFDFININWGSGQKPHEFVPELGHFLLFVKVSLTNGHLEYSYTQRNSISASEFYNSIFKCIIKYKVMNSK